MTIGLSTNGLWITKMLKTKIQNTKGSTKPLAFNDFMKKIEDPEAYFADLVFKIREDLKFEYDTRFQAFKDELMSLPEFAVNRSALEAFQKIIDTVTKDLKGDKGDSPSDEHLLELILPHIPEAAKNGDSYALTQEDRDDIAAGIEVPVVEKIIETRTIVEKQPIVTEKTIIVNQIKEKAVADKPPVVAKKLNTLTEKVNMSVIRGLERAFAQVYRAIKEKGGGGKVGGGMGNWIHQRFSTSSATTTLTLQSNIAANGLAHIFRYNGQVQDYGTDYTVNGKLITLLFTPDDNSVCSIAYVRK